LYRALWKETPSMKWGSFEMSLGSAVLLVHGWMNTLLHILSLYIPEACKDLHTLELFNEDINQLLPSHEFERDLTKSF